jgi:predicted nucleic acid-binding protein
LIFVDSSVWIDFFNGVATRQTDRLHSGLGTEDFVTGDLVLAEVLQGFRHDADFNRGHALMSTINVIGIGGQEVAVQAARNFRSLRSKGVTIRNTIDTLIATRCIVDDYALLYSDRDFDGFVQHLGLRSAIAQLS